MTHRVANCEKALLAAVEAMEEAMDCAINFTPTLPASTGIKSAAESLGPITEAEEIVLHEHEAKMVRMSGEGTKLLTSSDNTIDSSSAAANPQPPTTSFVYKLLSGKRRTSGRFGEKRSRGDGEDDHDDDDDDEVIIGVGNSSKIRTESEQAEGDATSLKSRKSARKVREESAFVADNLPPLITEAIANQMYERGREKCGTHNGSSFDELMLNNNNKSNRDFSSFSGGAALAFQSSASPLATCAAESLLLTSALPHSLALSITDVERQQLVSKAEARRREIKRAADRVNSAFTALLGAVDGLPDVPMSRIEDDLRDLTNENLALRDEVVNLYDKCVGLYERCLHVTPRTTESSR